MAFACLTQASVRSGVSGPIRGFFPPVERHVEGLSRGAPSACNPGGFKESLLAS